MSQHLDNIAQRATDMTYTSAAITIVGGITLNEWLALSGIVLGILTFCLNWYYKQQAWKYTQKRDREIDKRNGSKDI